MNYLQTFEGFEGVKKTKKIKKHWRSDRGGVSSVMGSISNKDANIYERWCIWYGFYSGC